MSSSERDDGSTGSPGRLGSGSILPAGESRRARIALWVATIVLVAGIAVFAWRFVGTLVLGLFAYYVTRPVFERVHGRIEQRTVAVVVSILTIALPVLLLVGWTVLTAVQAVGGFLGPGTRERLEAIVGPYLDLSTAFEDGEGIVRSLLTDPSRLQDVDPGTYASGVLDALLSSIGAVVGAALHAFIVLVIVFYLLRDDHRIAAWARGTFAPEGGVVETYLVRVDRELKSVFFGNILNALFTGLLAVVTFFVLNAFAPAIVRIPEPALLGLLVGAASLVPAIGIKLVTVPVGAYLLARSALEDPGTLWFPLVFFLVSFVVVDYIPDQLLRPYVSGRNLHVGAVMLAYLFGPLLFGWYGIFLGPLLLVLVFEFAQVVVPWLVDPDAANVAVSAGTESRTGSPTGDEALVEPIPEAEGGDRASGDGADETVDAETTSPSSESDDPEGR